MAPFNADAFLNSTVSGPMSTQVLQCDEGEYRATIEDGENAIQFREFTSERGVSHQMVVLFSILDDAQKARLGRDKILVPMNCWLDLDANGGLDMGKGRNVSIGRLREALEQNDSAPWSPARLKGAGPLMVKVTQRSDKTDPERKYAEVSRVAKIS